jgi:DNA repair exonuclease SbcCD ATPase subunit
MDIETYMHEVRGRLGAAAHRRDQLRSATLGPLGPIQEQIATATEKLRHVRDDLRAQKKQALHELAEKAKQRRAEASAEAARILEDADQEAKRLRRNVKELNENERAQASQQYTDLLYERTSGIEKEISSLREQESTSLADLGDDLAEADGEYRGEYEKILAERIITRKALETMGFQAPPPRRKQLDGAGNEQKAAAQ